MNPLLKFALFYIAMCLGFFVVLIFMYRGVEGIEWGTYATIFLGAPIFFTVLALLARKTGQSQPASSETEKKRSEPSS